MIAINEKSEIVILKYKAYSDDMELYLENPDGAPTDFTVEELDVSSELFLVGASCPDIETAKKWLAMGEVVFKKTKRDEIVREKMEEFYPNITDEIAILYRGTEAEKALHEQRYADACDYADGVTR